MGRPPASDARDTRQSILDAALELFAERGFFGTSMRELARAVGIRESAIYHHYENKEALLDALMNEANDERAHRFEQALADWGGLPVRELLHKVANLFLDHWEAPREQKLWRIMCTEGFRLGESGKFQMDASFRKPRALLEELFAKLAREKRIREVAPNIASLEFMAPMFMVRNMSASPKSFRLPEGVTARQVLEAHVAFFCDALGA